MTKRGEGVKNRQFWDDIVYGQPLTYQFLYRIFLLVGFGYAIKSTGPLEWTHIAWIGYNNGWQRWQIQNGPSLSSPFNGSKAPILPNMVISVVEFQPQGCKMR